MDASLLPAALVLTEAALRGAGVLLYLRRLALPAVAAEGRALLILPLTGAAPGLEDLFAALAAQTLRPHRLVVAVEDAGDPAAARAMALARLLPCPLDLVVAGRHDGRGQKNTNLIAALARIAPEDAVVVLLDADIRPPSWWLSALATPVLRGEADLVTGYRWPLPGGLAGGFWAALDRGFALLPKPAAFGFVWAGSLAIAPAAVARMGLARRLEATLSDDLSIGAAAARLGLRVLHRRALLLATPAEGAARAQLAFAHRQVQILRLYRPGWWALGAAGLAVSLAAWLALAAQAAAGGGVALAAAGAGAAAGLACWQGRRRVAARLGLPPDAPGADALQALLAALPPLPGAYAAGLFLAALRVRRIRWRHVDYAVAGPAAVRVTARRPAA